MYDAMLGGKDNYAADRAAVQQLTAQVPMAPDMARSNRAFHQRAAVWMAQRGIRQFLDLGAGLPTRDNTHEVVKRINPGCLVIYVDNDPVVLSHARALLSRDDDGVVAIGADVRDPESILGDEVVRNLIDFDAPCGVLMTGLLHFISDEDDPQGLMTIIPALSRRGAVSRWRRPPPTIGRRRRYRGPSTGYAGTSQGLHMRTRAQFTAMLTASEIVPPGVVLPHGVAESRSPRSQPNSPMGIRCNGGQAGLTR